MKERKKEEERRVDFLAKLDTLSTGERTALKRSLGQPLAKAEATAWAAFFKAMPACAQWEEEPYFLVACAYCFFSKSPGQSRSFIECLREISDESNGVKRRLFTLLDIPRVDSGYFSMKISRLLRMIYQKGGKPDFTLLLKDLLTWDNDNRYVQLRWAREFLGKSNKDKEDESNVS